MILEEYEDVETERMMVRWGNISIRDGETKAWRSGCTEWFLKRERDEWLVAFRENEPVDCEFDAEAREAPAEMDWTRYISTADETIALVPALPDRPVVVRPESPMVLLPGRRGLFYLSIPIWLRFVLRQKRGEQLMCERPSTTLSNIWFGAPSLGELCYSLDDPLRRSFESVAGHPLEAICPLRLQNSSVELLRFERICVHVEHLNVYSSDPGLWTNEVAVQFKGSDQVSQITIANAIPNGTKLLTARRVASSKSLLKKSFNLLRQVTGF